MPPAHADLLAVPRSTHIFNDQLTTREWSDFLTDLTKWNIMGQGTPEQQVEAREWFKEHYVGIAGTNMIFKLERVGGKKVEFKVDVQAMVNPQGEFDSRDTELALLRSRLLDQETSIEILSEMNRDLEIEIARMRNEPNEPPVSDSDRPAAGA